MAAWIMMDLETTGTDPVHAAILQIGAVRFNPYHLTIDTESMFSRCMLPAAGRFWDESTRNWWASQPPDVYSSIMARAEEPGVVLQAFIDWVGPDDAVFVSKPLSFDAPFIASYLKQFELRNPFPHFWGCDVRSLIAGLTWGRNFDEKSVPFTGPAHDALFDCLHQIKLIFSAIQHSQKVIAP